MTLSQLCRLATAVLCTAGGLSLGGAALAAPDYLDPEAAFVGSARLNPQGELELRWKVAPGYHLYRERIGLASGDPGLSLSPAQLPPGREVMDEALGQTVHHLSGEVVAKVPAKVSPGAGALAMKAEVQYQGCADEGLCYPPQTAQLRLQADAQGRLQSVRWLAPGEGDAAAPAAMAGALTEAKPSAKVPEQNRLQAVLQSGQIAWVMLVFLGAGLLLSFTPCVLPMVPILSSIIVGSQAPVSRSRGFSLALAYSLGMALVYTAMGMAAGLAGEGLAAALQNPWVLGTFALALGVVALSMFDVFQLEMPGFIQNRLTQASARMPGGRFGGVFAMGGVSALIVGPCVAAPLAGALVFISQTRNVWLGGVALFSLAMGMSVPLLLVGLSAGTLLPRAGAWMGRVKAFFGVLLLAVAWWLVQPVLSPAWAMGLAGAGLVALAVGMGLLEPAHRHTLEARMVRGMAAVLALLGTAQLVGAMSGGRDVTQPLGHLARQGVASPAALAGGEGGGGAPAFKRVSSQAELQQVLATAARPVMVDVYADWCVSCKEMEHLTFSDSAVRKRLNGATLVQLDVTANNAEDKALLKRFGLFGPPAVMFFHGGQERAAARVVGYQTPREFEVALSAAGL
jgi:thioredoxin:protein disulfide reductase